MFSKVSVSHSVLSLHVWSHVLFGGIMSLSVWFHVLSGGMVSERAMVPEVGVGMAPKGDMVYLDTDI